MSRRFPLMILCAANFLFAVSVLTTHSASPTLVLWARYLPYETLLGAFLYSGITSLAWLRNKQPSERRLVFYFIGSMVGFSAYFILSFTYGISSGNWNAILLVGTLYALVIWLFAEGYLG